MTYRPTYTTIESSIKTRRRRSKASATTAASGRRARTQTETDGSRPFNHVTVIEFQPGVPSITQITEEADENFFNNIRWKYNPSHHLHHLLPRWTVSSYTLCSEKNTHSHFLSYLSQWCVDLNKNCSEYSQGKVHSDNIESRYSLWPMT